MACRDCEWWEKPAVVGQFGKCAWAKRDGSREASQIIPYWLLQLMNDSEYPTYYGDGTDCPAFKERPLA